MINLTKLFIVPMLFASTLHACNNTTTEQVSTTTEQSAAPQEKSIKDLVKEGAMLVDVRSPEEFASGSVPGAVNIPLGEVEARVKEFENKNHIIVFCASGNRSGQAKRILDSKGVAPVTNGGAWTAVKAALE